MIVVLDTNVILDALQERQPFDKEAKEILIKAQQGVFECYFTANAATDIFYLYSKARDISSARQVISFLLNTYKVISVNHEDCIKALSVPIDDFEDALVVSCAKKVNADYLITRDYKFLQAKSDIKLVSPKDFLNNLK